MFDSGGGGAKIFRHHTSGHDLRLDEMLKSKRRRVRPTTTDELESTDTGSTSTRGVYVPDVEAGIDWREEIRRASQLPEVGTRNGPSGMEEEEVQGDRTVEANAGQMRSGMWGLE